jgi:hypothetical protein
MKYEKYIRTNEGKERAFSFKKAIAMNKKNAGL